MTTEYKEGHGTLLLSEERSNEYHQDAEDNQKTIHRACLLLVEWLIENTHTIHDSMGES